MKTVYADYAASAPVSETALAVFAETARICGNPSSGHEAGQAAAEAVESARGKVAELIGASPEEIFFTSGGTESDNWAVFSGFRLACRRRERPPVIAVSAIEHDAVYKAASAAVSVRDGGSLAILPVSADGVAEVPDEKEVPDCALISVMTANNETGVIQPIGAWAAAAARRGALFHTDAVQAAGHIPVDVRRIGTDLLSLSAHKLHGPAGIGALYIRKEIAEDFPPLFYGGGQERGKRPGTVPAALIAAFGAAAEESRLLMERERVRCASLRDRIEAELLKIPGSVRNGEGERLPGICSISFRGVGGEAAALLCGLNGVMLSSGSACHAGSEKPSRVLLAMTGDAKRASSALRISVGRGFEEDDAEAVIRTVTDVVRQIREA